MNESATDENIAEATAPVEKEKKEAVMPNNMPSAADKLAALKTRMNKG